MLTTINLQHIWLGRYLMVFEAIIAVKIQHFAYLSHQQNCERLILAELFQLF